MNCICILTGGKDYTISVDGKLITFEDHPYCGPTVLNKRTRSPLANQPARFLYAASQWATQGRKVEDGLCVWFHEPKEILKHMGGKHWLLVGEEPAVRGS